MKKNCLTLMTGLIFSACLVSCNSNQKPTTDILPIFDEDGIGNFINVQTGDIITPKVDFTASSLFNGGVASVQLPFEGGLSDRNLATFVNTEGKPIVEGKSFISFTTMNNGVAWVVEPDRGIMILKDNGKIDDRTFVEMDLLKAYPFFENKAVVRNRYHGWSVVNKSGDYLYHFKNMVASPCVVNDMVVEVTEEGRGNTKYGIVNINGTEVTAPTWDFVGTSDYNKHFITDVVAGFHDGRILVMKERKWGVINTKGEIVINPQFNSLHIDGDMYMFEKDDRWGWCSLEGQYIINPQFREVGAFNGGELAPAKDKESREWGYVDKTGKWVINPQFDKAGSFDKSGYAIAKLGNEYGLIDKTGKWVINPQFYDLISLEEDSRYLAEMSRDSYAIVDQTGKMVSKTEFKFHERILNPFFLFDFAAESNYINYGIVQDDLKKLTAKIKATTSGELKKTLGEKAFSKNGGYIKIETIDEDQYDISLKAYCNNAWSRVSDGWWSYKYVFNPNVEIGSFVVTIRFNESNRVNTLLEKMKWNSNSSTVNIDGKQYQVEPDYERFEVKFKCDSANNNNNI